MDEKDLKYFKEKLNKWKDDLLTEAGVSVERSLTTEQERRGDFSDLANIEADQNFLLRIKDRERKLIAKIESCLLQIEEGTYGLCKECGDEIDIKRLEARPVASLCIVCKTEQEKHER